MKTLLAALLIAAPAFATLNDTSGGRQTRTGNGATTTFVYTFPAGAATDVSAAVTLAGVAQAATYTVTLNGDQINSPGGTIIFSAAPANTAVITIQRSEPLSQLTSLPPFSPFPAKTVERTFDGTVRKVQQVDRRVADLELKETADISNAIMGGVSTANLIAPIATGATTAITLADRFGMMKRVEDFGVLCNGVNDDAANFASASVAAVAANVTLLIDCKVRIASAAGSIAANLRFAAGGAIDVSPVGGTVTLTGGIDAPITKIFYTGAGTLTLNGFTKTLWVLPQWWGAQGIGGVTDDGPALQAAINAASPTFGQRGVVYLPPGAYRYTTPLLHQQDIAIYGSGPKFGGTSLQPDGCAAFKFIGASYAGGFAFRATVRDLVIQPLNTPANTKIVELNNAYSILFSNILLSTVADNGSIGFDATDVNELVFEGVRIDGASNGTSKGIVLHVGADKTSAQCIHCDIENLNIGIEVLDASVMDVIAPYMERNIIAIKNSSNLSGTLGGGHLNVFGGIMHCPGGSQVCLSTTGSAPTTVIATTLNNGSGVGNKFATGTTSLINFFDTSVAKWFIGTAPTGSNNLTPTGAVTLGTQNGIDFTGSTFAALGVPANGRIIYCTDCTVANPCAGAGTGAFAKRLNGAWVCN